MSTNQSFAFCLSSVNFYIFGMPSDPPSLDIMDLLLACRLLSVLDRLSWLTFCWYSILASATFTPPMEFAAGAAEAATTADLDDEEDEDPCDEMSLPFESRLTY